MNMYAGRSITLICVASIMMLTSCNQGPSTTAPDDVGSSHAFAETPDPAIARTLQAEAAMTAAWLLTLTPAVPTPTEAASPTIEAANMVGTPMASRTGDCPIPGGYVLQDREGFCLSTPSSWVIFSVDGGVAGFLKTTPGQAISLQPDWAQSSEVCSLLIYVSTEVSAAEHLATRHQQFASRADIQEITPVQAFAVGEMGMPGFMWRSEGGESGAIYADVVGPGRLLHISYGGTSCSQDDLLPVLDMLRIK
jgi:hypothetical protein